MAPAPERSPAGGVAITIVTYAAPDKMLEAAVDAVLASANDIGRTVSVWVVDNANTATRRLADRAVTVVQADANLGFAAAVNRGFALGREAGAEYLVCLNDDVVVTHGWLQPLLDRIDADPSLGGVQPVLVSVDSGLIDGAGVEIDRFGAGSDRLRGRDANAATASEVEALTGGAAMFSSAAIDDVGPMDERFFLYYEDVEWCRRARRSGWRFAVEPSSVVYHHGSATTSGLGNRVIALQERNRLWDTAMHGTARELAAGIGLSLRRLRHHPRSAHARGLVDGLAGLPARLMQRGLRKSGRYRQRSR